MSLIYLVQTDTTVGFASDKYQSLNIIKEREKEQKCLNTVSSFSELKDKLRAPQKYKNLIRRSKKTTFIYSNGDAIRVVKDCDYSIFLQNNGQMYSTSSNKTKCSFDYKWASSKSDVIVFSKKEHFEGKASLICKLSKNKIKILRHN